MTDPINHPPHYGGDTPYETIKVIEAWNLDYSLGNAVKYISRAGKKPGVPLLDDLRKAEWYIKHAIERAQVVDTGRGQEVDRVSRKGPDVNRDRSEDAALAAIRHLAGPPPRPLVVPDPGRNKPAEQG